MLHFTGLTIENFGPYKGKQDIDFTSDNGVTIIWGNNGLGKSALLNVFRYALFGKVQGRGTKVHSLKQIANWESYDEGIYGFKVALKMLDNGIPYELTRQFAVKDGITNPVKDSDYKENVFLRRDTTILSSEEREHIINSIMPEQVSRFFLFDGELLHEYEELLENDSSAGVKIKESIERILGVPVLTNGLSDIKTAEKEYSSRLSKVAQKNQTTQVLGNLLETKQAELKKHEEELEELKGTQSKLTDERTYLEEEMKQTEKARELLKEREVLQSTISRKKGAKSIKEQEMRNITKNAWQGMLSQRIKAALNQLETEIKYYEDKKTKHFISTQLVEQIKSACEKGICPICEQHLTDLVIQSLKFKTKSNIGFGGLSSEEYSKLIDLQGRRSQLSKLDAEDLKLQVAEIERAIADITVDISDAEQRIDDINKNLAEAGDVSRAASIQVDFAKCLGKIDNTEKGITEERDIIIRVSSEIKNIEDKIKHQATDVELIKAKKKSELCEKVRIIFEAGVNLYREQLKQKVESDASDIFVKIANQTEYTSLKINENYGLSIIHQSGRVVEIRSSGYEHIVALSLIGALHKNAPLQGPIIMDSPFGRLDPEHRRKITAALPSLAEQVLLLVYIDEIDEQLARRTLGCNLKNEYSLSSISAFHTKIIKT